jgi:HAMP domain-containing protein
MDLTDLINAYIAESQMERLRGYLERGRKLADLPTEALNAAWVDLYRATRGRERASRENELQDLSSEFELRGIEPPMHLVAAEAEQFKKRFERQIRESKIDRDAVAKMEEELERLRGRLEAPKH